eukprot:TRINITY_DN6738_c0_g1_i4.p1 TRINITY_DN6738_c0_g1~~TRINITY_DN6738_c0_g1_i4.p1  ORF type:complete len:167 (-),score=43.39 TRINITY_DN6738_c0_g1_i4:100-600(-)
MEASLRLCILPDEMAFQQLTALLDPQLPIDEVLVPFFRHKELELRTMALKLFIRREYFTVCDMSEISFRSAEGFLLAFWVFHDNKALARALSRSKTRSNSVSRHQSEALASKIQEALQPDKEDRNSAGQQGVLTVLPVSYTHLRAHETPEHLVCRLLLEKKKKKQY